MRIRTANRVALGICATAALLSACAAPQPGAMPQTPTLAAGGDSGNYRVVYNFGGSPDAAEPTASLIDVNGTLYGTTTHGGAYSSSCYASFDYGCGTVFTVTPHGSEKLLYSFRSGTDGSYPEAGLLNVDGTLYGTTNGGGSSSCASSPCGTVFSITPSGTEKVLHVFGRGSDGSSPVASLIEVEGKLYGTTARGGHSRHFCLFNRCGTVFSITPHGTEKVLHSFGSGADGADPLARLIDLNGKLYGTTLVGGRYGSGTVFTITPGGKEQVLYSFGAGSSDGIGPEAGLTDVDGTLYGTTGEGGAGRCQRHRICGTVFSITPSGTEKVLHTFGGSRDGAYPSGSLIEVKGMLYGTTLLGGKSGTGTVFGITLRGTERVLHSFGRQSGSDGSSPFASLIEVKGRLYGTTEYGGAYFGRCFQGDGCGTVFALTP